MPCNPDPRASRDLQRARAEQAQCRDYLRKHGYDRGAALGLFDNLMEECILLLRESAESCNDCSTE